MRTPGEPHASPGVPWHEVNFAFDHWSHGQMEIRPMRPTAAHHDASRSRSPRRALALLIALLAFLARGAPAHAAALGRISGRVLATDTGEPLAFADVVLTARRHDRQTWAGMTNADGSSCSRRPRPLHAAIRALSYTTKSAPELADRGRKDAALQHRARRPRRSSRRRSWSGACAHRHRRLDARRARRRRAAIGDAVSAEQVRRSPDKNAGDVLRR